ncbi:tyrosine-protein kinase JAK2-like isoform X2 [Dreissena polymorpha]|nr:tyrosine-protein kinase JAK2-like isoform X2 [Dreissena polymorpha]
MLRRRKDKKNYDPMDSGSQSGSSFTRMSFQVSVYGPDRECMKIDVNPSDTYEEVCEAVAERLEIPPAMFHCCGLCVLDVEQKRFLWLPPTKNVIHSRNDVYFRIRFLPHEDNIDVLERKYSPCFQYLFYQLKWDFLHECLSYYTDPDKASEARGAGTFLLAMSVRISAKENNQEENCKEFLEQNDLKMFLPKCVLKSFVDRMMVKSPLIEKANELLKDKHPADLFKKYFVKGILSKSINYYSIEEYRCWNVEYKETKESDTSGKTQTLFVPQLQNSDKEDVLLKTEIKGIYSQISSESLSNSGTMKNSCKIESIHKVENEVFYQDGKEWHKVRILAQGFSQEVCFKDKMEMYSFLTAVEKCYCLFVDFYGSRCHDVRSPTTSALHQLRVHGPVSQDFLKKKLENYLDCGQMYAMRMSLDKYGCYDVFYLKNQGDKLYVCSSGKVVQNIDGYTIKDSNIAAVADLKTLLMQYVSSLKSIPNKCTRIKPEQFEGCDEIKKYLLDKVQLQSSEAIEDDEQARRRLENAPKVYMKSQVVHSDEIGLGYFTEVNRALLNEDQQVIVKRLKHHPAIKQNHQELQEALMESVSKLMEWDSAKFFVGVHGICLMPEPSILMSGTSFCSLKQFLLSERTDNTQLKLEHLMQVPVFLLDALLYMEEKNCYHGNINCDNLVVERFDLVLKLADPGMVAIRNKLPLDHVLNVERLPWLAPERMQNLSHVTVKSEVWAIGTTLWQMFSGARNPCAEVQEKLSKTGSTALSDTEVVQFFQDTKGFSCPKYLKPEPSDPKQVLLLKDKFYQAILPCWTIDSEDRPNTTMLLRTFIEICQSYGPSYHTYSSLDYSGFSVEHRPQSVSSGGLKSLYSITRDMQRETKDVPDISALTGDASKGHLLPQNSRSLAASPPIEAAGDRPAPNNPVPAAHPKNPSGDRVFRNQRSHNLGTVPAVPSQRHKIQPKHLLVDKNKKLGQGYYGAVYKAQLTKENNIIIDVVAKFLKSDNPNDDATADFEKEAKFMALLEHDNIVKFYGTCYTDSGLCLVMDYLPKKSLKEYLRSTRQDIPDCQLFQFAVDIAFGMEYLESKKIMHCDLAARNVLLNSELRAKVCDFGLSRMLEKDYYRLHDDKTIPLYWSAPEWNTTKNVSHKSDVWSFGVVLWEMFSNGSDPKMKCESAKEFVLKIASGERLKKPEDCPDDMYSFMKECWNAEKEKRPSFTQCKEKFIQSLMSERCAHDTHRSLLTSLATVRGPRGDILTNGVGHGTAVARLPGQTGGSVTEVITDLSTSDKTTNTNRYSLVLSETSLQIFLDKNIGKGAFGDILMGRFESRDVAVKKCRNASEYQRFEREFEILCKLKRKQHHPNIVEFIGLYDLKDPTICYVYVMEYAENKSLVKFLTSRPEPVMVHQKLKLLKDAAHGMQFIFENNIIHCDLTAENILVKADLTALISDFGWAKELETDVEDFTYMRSNPKTKILWSAPEVLQSKYSKFTDNWSYGVVCCEVFLDGKQPGFDDSAAGNKDEAEIYWQKINQGQRFPCPELCPKEIYDDVMLRCWEKDFMKRIHFHDIVTYIGSW